MTTNLPHGWDLGDETPDGFDVKAALAKAKAWTDEDQAKAEVELEKRLAADAEWDEGSEQGANETSKESDDRGGGSNLPVRNEASNELIAKLNSIFFLLTGSESVVVEILQQEQGVLRYKDYTIASFRVKYCNKWVLVKEDKKDDEWVTLAKYFINHPVRKDIDRRLFAPGRILPTNEFNTFPGFPITPTETGNCSLFWEHFEQNVCGGDEIRYNYHLKWMAHIFQRPEKKTGVMMVLVGEERGSGKSIIGFILNKLLGDGLFVRIDNQVSLTGEFTKHRDNKLLINLEESINPNDPRATSMLKNLITVDKRLSHEKYHTAEMVETFENIFVTSNDVVGAVHVEQGDRRVCVYKVRPGWSKPHPTSANEWVAKKIERNGRMISKFVAMLEDLENGGYGRLMYDLIQEDLTDFDVSDFPRTEARAQQSLGSLSIELQFYYNALADRAHDFFDRGNDPGKNYLSKNYFYAEFEKFARSARRGYNISNVNFGRELKGVWPKKYLEPVPKDETKTRFKLHRSGKKGEWQYILGTVTEHREAFTAKTNIQFEYDYDDVGGSDAPPDDPSIPF